MSTMLTVADVVARNVGRLRKRRGLSLREMSKRLGSIGQDMSADTLNRIEASDPAKRRGVDVEKLAALAYVLETSPAYLLSSDSPEEVDGPDVLVTGDHLESTPFYSRWVRGEMPLPAMRDEAYLESAPALVQRLQAKADHPVISALTVLRSMVRQALDPKGELVDPAASAEYLRTEGDRLHRYLDLLADEVARMEPRDGSWPSYHPRDPEAPRLTR